MMELDELRGMGTIMCMVGFFAVVIWAYAPSQKKRFEADADLPFAEDVKQQENSK